MSHRPNHCRKCGSDDIDEPYDRTLKAEMKIYGKKRVYCGEGVWEVGGTGCDSHYISVMVLRNRME